MFPGLPQEAESSPVGEAVSQDLGSLPDTALRLAPTGPHGPGRGPDVWEAMDLTGQL